MALQDEILKQSTQIKTDSYPMSIGELINLYRDKEIDVHPEFQRFYRWSNTQKTRLIESILLGIPIPPIFVAQRTDGVWDVVDGVQRLSTILQFVGELKDESDQKVEPLILEATKFLPSLKGCSWVGEKGFAKELQLYVKRAKIDVNIVLKESDEKSKYELFMRLNTGGAILTSQEVRNCLMVMEYRPAYEWIQALSKNTDFESTVSASDKDLQEQYSLELVTRFLTFRTLSEPDLNEVVDIGDYLDDSVDKINNIAKNNKSREAEHRAFETTFKLLNLAVQDNAFKRYDSQKQRFLGSFSISAFEVIAIGLGYNVDEYNSFDCVESEISEKVKSVWSDPVFKAFSGSGVRASTRIPKIIPLGRKLFSK